MDKSVPRVAVLMAAESNCFHELGLGIAAYAMEHGPWEFVHGGSLGGMRQELPDDWQGDGVIGQFFDDRWPKYLRKRGIPAVNISNRVRDIDAPRVGPDDLIIGELGAGHFLERGFVHLAFFGIEGHWYSQRRQEAFEKAVRKVGCECRSFSPRFAYDQPMSPQDEEELDKWLTGLPLPVAVMACNDVRGRHVIDACSRLGLAVPEQVAVLGVDNEGWQGALAKMPLSSVEHRPRDVGYEAGKLLSSLMSGKPVATRSVFVQPMGIISRRSSDVIATADSLVATAIGYIRENFNKPITVEDMLEATGASRRMLETRFSHFLGCTPLHAIWRVRVENAKSLLSQTDMPIKAIALRCGFPNARRMNTIFHRLTGQTPAQYIRRDRGR